ncbi:leucine-rich repeat transmembrane protein kinase protein [Tanacetum coccineum]
MKMFRGFLTLLALHSLIFTSVLVHSQDDQSGFISIDCGIVGSSTYTDNVSLINYVSDAGFIDSGEMHNILPIYNLYGDVDKQLTTLTSFPQNTRNCYTLKPTQGKGNRYLIRTRFMYGDYDFKSQLPEFDVYLGPDYWDTIKFRLSSIPVSMEIIHVLSSDYVYVCLVHTGHGGLDPGLANLTLMHTLDLSNNNLTGTLPNFLSELNFLKVLNLNGNNFKGPIPARLLAKVNNGSLSLSFTPISVMMGRVRAILQVCDKNSCKNKNDNKIIVPVIAAVASLFVILSALAIIWVIKRQRERGTGLEIRKKQYTYSEVQSITDNFNVVLGKGGFGTVYQGYIDDTPVAVKMLSGSSLQGDKEFQAEIPRFSILNGKKGYTNRMMLLHDGPGLRVPASWLQ